MKYFLKRALASALAWKSKVAAQLPIEIQERKHTNRNVPNYNDSSYFFGRSRDGAAMATRLSFRTGKESEYWLRLKLPDKGHFMLRDLKGPEGEKFEYGDFAFTCLEPGKKWEITFEGVVYQKDKPHKLALDLTFDAISDLINFQKAVVPWEVGGIVAGECWTKDFLKKLGEVRIAHFEQAGNLSGSLALDGESRFVNWKSVRDHSFGRRSWQEWNRHVWLVGVLEDERVVNVCVIHYNFLGQLKAGFVTYGTQGYSPVKKCITLEEIPMPGEMPRSFQVPFQTQDKKEYTLSVKTKEGFDFVMDNDDYHITEWIADFDLNGVKGIGIAEFGLNPQKYALNPQKYEYSVAK